MLALGLEIPELLEGDVVTDVGLGIAEIARDVTGGRGPFEAEDRSLVGEVVEGSGPDRDDRSRDNDFLQGPAVIEGIIIEGL